MYAHLPLRGSVLATSALVLLLSACVSAQPTNTLVANLPRSGPTPVAVEASPGPIPSAPHSSSLVFVSLSPWPLHGSPPFTANFSADVSGSSDQGPVCQTAQWDFGDGNREVQPCSPGESLRQIQISHIYREAGTYHVCVRLSLSDGREVTSTTQTVVVANPQPISQSAEVLRWSAWAMSVLAAIGVCLWLRRRSRRWKIGGYVVIALGLITFVPPFSYIPNPIGLVWSRTGGYAYDPRLPFVNRFVVAGDPEAQLRPFLDGLIGETGLDPLDPVQPLSHYEFVRVSLPSQYHGIVFVTTRLTYQDGSQRTYDIPLYQPNDFLGFYRSEWRYDGLGRLRTEQRELAGTPFADASASLRLSTPQRLSLRLDAQPFDTGHPAAWGPYSNDWQHLIWSPQGDAFLASLSVTDDRRDLWQINLDGRPPLLIGDDVIDYNWSPDGQYIIFTRLDEQPDAVQATVFVVSRESGKRRELAHLEQLVFPGLSSEGIWYVAHGDLWVAPFSDQPPQRIATLPELTASPAWDAGPVIRPAPDGTRIAYTCAGGNAVCLYDRASTQSIQIDVLANDLAWSRDSLHLATITNGTYGNSIEGERPVVLTLVGQDGLVEWATSIAPNGWADAPQWTPDARRIFIQTYPFGGRRILTVDVSTGEALDLSQPRWDAWFALSPDGTHLLLSNGRGGFWSSMLHEGPAR